MALGWMLQNETVKVAFKITHGIMWGLPEHSNEISGCTKDKIIEWLSEYQILIPIDVFSHSHTHTCMITPKFAKQNWMSSDRC
jgi:hypothetical protein